MWKKEMTEDEIDAYFSDIYKTKNTEVIYKNECGEIYKTRTYDLYDDGSIFEKLSFEDFMVSIEDSIFSSFEEYINYLNYDFSEEQYFENDGLPLMKKIHDEVLETYSDYKRGYTKYLYVYELDYNEFDLKPPKNKKDRIYLGVSYTSLVLGDIVDFSIGQVKPHEKKIVVTEWVAK